MKRIAIATACGMAAGMVCVTLGAIAGLKITPVSFGWAMLNRTLLGFVIGISALRLPWAWHGPVMGVLVGSLFAYSLWMSGTPALLSAGVIGGSAFLAWESSSSPPWRSGKVSRSRPWLLLRRRGRKLAERLVPRR